MKIFHKNASEQDHKLPWLLLNNLIITKVVYDLVFCHLTIIVK